MHSCKKLHLLQSAVTRKRCDDIVSDDSDPGHSTCLLHKLASVVGEENVVQDVPLKRHTTFAIGGPADYFVCVDNYEEIRDIICICNELNEPYFILGCGSDLLVSDEGYRGVVIAMTSGLLNVNIEGTLLTCQAGVALKEASEMACELGLSGLEFACGIPGSVGGACYMNAGAYDGCIADVLHSVRVVDNKGNYATIDAQDLELGYRTSRIKTQGLVVLSATFALTQKDTELIREKMDEFTARRQEKQPLELPSAGSTFKRPEGFFAGKLISDAGLMGYRVGGAEVSQKHAGFVVNVDNATAADVHAVIEHVQDEVEQKFGVRLEPEVLFL